MRKPLIILVIIAAFAVALFSYPQLPERTASHWDSSGNVNDTMPKFWGAFLIPLVMLAMYFVFQFIPRIDPKKKNIERFRTQYDTFILLILTFLFAAYVFTILWNFGIEIHPNLVFPIGLGVIFYYLGVLCHHAKRNYFIGIRTPWTLASERVWNKTHQLGGKLFKIAGVISVFSVFFGKYAVLIAIVPILVAVLVLFVYSYLEFRR